MLLFAINLLVAALLKSMDFADRVKSVNDDYHIERYLKNGKFHLGKVISDISYLDRREHFIVEICWCSHICFSSSRSVPFPSVKNLST